MTDHIEIGDITPRIQYEGDGSLTDFSYLFPIFDDEDMQVFVDGTLMTLTTDYTVAGAGESGGGTVSFVAAPDDGAIVTLVRSLTIKRTTDFQPAGQFRAKVLNDELDKHTAMIQQVDDRVDRTIQLSETDAAATLTLPEAADRASKMLAFDEYGDVTVSTLDLADIESQAAAAAASAAQAADSAIAAASDADDATTAKAAAESARDDAQIYATAAAAAAGSNLFNAVYSLDNGDTPYAVVSDTDDGTMFVCDMSSGNLTLNLPSIATAGEGERYGFLRQGASNTLTLARNGTDTINGVDGNYTVEALDGTIILLVADDTTPDNWIVIPWTQARAGTGLSQSGSTISLDVDNDNTWTAPQRAAAATDNDGSFDLTAKNNFECAPSGSFTFQFTGESSTEGQTGVIYLDNSSGHAVTKGGEVIADDDFEANLSTAGVYLVTYFVLSDGATVAVSYTGALS